MRSDFSLTEIILKDMHNNNSIKKNAYSSAFIPIFTVSCGSMACVAKLIYKYTLQYLKKKNE